MYNPFHLISAKWSWISMTIVCLGIMTFFFPACKSKKQQFVHVPLTEYYSTKPLIVNLSSQLDEISGIYFYAKDTSIFSINDEDGTLYKISLTNNVKVNKWNFGQPDDYEDLTMVDSTFYVLKSNGTIIAFKVFVNQNICSQTYKISLKGSNEFETLYHDPKKQKLVMMCKDCEVDDEKRLTAYSFDLKSNSFDQQPYFIMDIASFEKKMSKKSSRFKPSAAAIHPITNQLFILSSVNKALVIAQQNGTIEKMVALNNEVFKKPEGIAFTPRGDLMISNEAGDFGSPNIIIYKYDTTQHEKK